MAVRPLAADDLDRIKAIDRKTFAAAEQYDDGMYELMLGSGFSLVAVKHPGVVVGYAFVQMNPDTHVRSLAVHPDFQREGYGEELMRAVIGNAPRGVDLLVDEANARAVSLYEKLGFRRAEMCPTLPPKRRMVLSVG